MKEGDSAEKAEGGRKKKLKNKCHPSPSFSVPLNPQTKESLE
jgi:hypothetical protein